MKQMLGLVVMLCLDTSARPIIRLGWHLGRIVGRSDRSVDYHKRRECFGIRLQRKSSEGSWTDNHFRKHFNFRHTTRICDYIDETRPDYCCRALSWPIWRGRCGVGAAIAHGQIRHYQKLKGLAYNLNPD
jgi:hypothetical protein